MIVSILLWPNKDQTVNFDSWSSRHFSRISTCSKSDARIVFFHIHFGVTGKYIFFSCLSCENRDHNSPSNYWEFTQMGTIHLIHEVVDILQISFNSIHNASFVPLAVENAWRFWRFRWVMWVTQWWWSMLGHCRQSRTWTLATVQRLLTEGLKHWGSTASLCSS